jgi:vacuolar iron transporter family protein
MAHDAIGAHTRDELGISETTAARAIQAALASAISFSVGAALPLLAVILAPVSALAESVAAGFLLFLAFLGAVGARTGGANMLAATIRVTFWGALAMAMTAGIGALFRTAM